MKYPYAAKVTPDREAGTEHFHCGRCGYREERPAGVLRPKAMIARLKRFRARCLCQRRT